MPSKKRKYNARFPAGRIKRIMQADEEVGKIAQAVPIIISRTLELFVESLLTKSSQITLARNAKTLSPTHLKQCIMSESRFDFLKDLVKNIPDIAVDDGSNFSASHDDQHNNSTSSNGMDQSNNGSHRIIIQRSQSLQQPSTSNHHYQNIAAAAVPTTRVQQKQFFLNNYTSIPSNHNNNNNNNNNILNVLNNTKLNPNIPATADSSGVNYNPPLKIFRINSSPATATITSAEHRQQQQQNQKQSLAPLEFPIKISYNIDGSSSTSINSPTVKIDYSNLAMPATSPSIKIDLSHFNTQLASSSSNKTPIQPSSNANITMPSPSTGSLDEDYDT